MFREIDKKFLLMALRSTDVQSQFQEKMKQMAQPKLALKRISGARVPVPPLAEQHRIVAIVDKLTGLCDRLEKSLASVEDTRRRLLDALLAEALEPVEGDLEPSGMKWTSTCSDLHVAVQPQPKAGRDVAGAMR